ncbi:mannose-1-phosphate guanylyltransferase [soil metagenome]
MNQKIFVVIMAGGIGSRFWPYSRNDHPKQFLDVLGIGNSLLQMTYERFLPLCPKENILVVTNEAYAGLVHEQLPEIKKDQVLLEPTRRNTAPCIAYACYKIYKKDPDSCIIIAPSDHAIFKEALFEQTIMNAVNSALENDKLITLGIKPNRPETGYGYIQYHQDTLDPIKKVKTFTEKPQLDLARKFLESGDFVWNAGIFIWNSNSIIQAFNKYMPDTAEIFEEGYNFYYTEKEDAFIKKAYSQCKNVSIDYGIMEKADNVYVVLGDFGWSDLGSWNSLHEIKEKDESLNVIDANALVYESTNCIIKGPKDTLVVLQGLEGYLVAACDNVVLICKKDEEQKFREFTSDVKSKKGNLFL